MRPAEIAEIVPGSLAEKHGLKAGDKIVSINGRLLRDILDYQICIADEEIELELVSSDKTIIIRNPKHESLGIRFSTSLFDGIKTCANKCVFCFIDQLPPGMRKAVYVKDDDYRLSFLYGNFVTLTNVKEEEIQRVIDDRISPLYVSLHCVNEALRAKMLGRKKHDKTLDYLKELSDAGIELHIQMVMCPGLNDKAELDYSIEELSGNYPGVASVGLVPVGLTAHREGLYPLRSFEKQEIIELVEQAKRWQERFEKEKGYAWLYIADEFYIAAGLELPPDEHYGDYPQIENGVGLSRLFIDEALDELESLKGSITQVGDGSKSGVRPTGVSETSPAEKSIAVVTGELFGNILKDICDRTAAITGREIIVVPVKNLFFGGKVNVTGLLTGSDILRGLKRWLEGRIKPGVVFLPGSTLNADGLMLDGISPEEIAKELGIRVKVVESSGRDFMRAIEDEI